MDLKKEGTFECHICHMQEVYTYFGNDPSPRWSKLLFSEELFMVRNPFLSANVKVEDSNMPFLVLGGLCRSCEKQVCLDPSCSIYADGRTCLECKEKHPQL